MHIEPIIVTRELNDILRALSRRGEAFLVGGCVRDTLMSVPVNDIDIATNLPPEKVKEALSNLPVRIYDTGIDHGTITVSGEENFEITTYRRDVATDGRRATVAYAHTMEEDAQRRDFTMNALYMDRWGKVYDPTGEGIKDVLARRVRFVGNAGERCREDYLRILRLFRFHAKYGIEMDWEAYEAAAMHKDGLLQVSKERIWDELKKLLSCKDPTDALWQMDRTGVSGVLFDQTFPEMVHDLVNAEDVANVSPHYMRRFHLWTYLTDIPFPSSKVEDQHLERICSMVLTTPEVLGYVAQDWQLATDVFLIDCVEMGYTNSFPSEEIARGMATKLPVAAQDFMDAGVEPGPKLGQMMRDSNRFFMDDFTMDKKKLFSLVWDYHFP